MQHTASSASDPSRDIRIFREETHGGQIFTTFFAVDQLCKLIPNSNVETLKRVGSRRVCIYIYPCKISSYRSHVTELLMILNSEIRNLEIVFTLPVINSRDYIPSSKRETNLFDARPEF